MVLNTPGFLRYYDETIDLLLERGHEVLLGFTDARMRAEALANLDERPRRPTLLGQVPRRDDRYAPVADEVRALVDFARYLHPRFAPARFLRDRRRLAVLELPVWADLLGDRDNLPAPLARALSALLLTVERAVPSAPDIEAFLRETAADVVLVSPLVTPFSPQTDYVKSARVLGLPCGLCVASWDNLTNKGVIHEQPDRVFVWNAAQAQEAADLHGVASERIVITGAQPFDRLFSRGPATDREVFCRRVGLDPRRPFVLFTGSTSNITDHGEEDRFVRRWIQALRSSPDPTVAGAGVLVRPHPDRRGAWPDLGLGGVADAVVWPPERPNSVTSAARDEYLDSLVHAAAVVGVNTSAMVEAAVIDRPVLSLRLPEFREAHEGTLHFAHLEPGHGGPLAVARSLDAHIGQLGELLRDPAPASARNRRFVEAFVRPHGMERPATPVLADAVEALGALQPAAARGAAWRPARALVHAELLVHARRTKRRERREERRARLATMEKVDLKPLRRWTKRTNRRLERRARRVERRAPPVAGGLRRMQAGLDGAVRGYEVRVRRREQARKAGLAVKEVPPSRARVAAVRRRWEEKT